MLIFLFLIFVVVMIGLVVYGFVVVNKQRQPKMGTTREEAINQVTARYNEQIVDIRRICASQLSSAKNAPGRMQLLDSLTKAGHSRYESLREEYQAEVNSIKATMPETKPDKVRKYWNNVVIGGLIASLGGCFGSAITIPDEEQGPEPQRLASTTDEWTEDNISIPFYEDSLKHVSNPERIINQEAEDSLNRILNYMDSEQDIQAIVVVVGHVRGGEAQPVALALGDRHGVGRNNRGLVVLLAYDDHDINISTGKYLDADLTDTRCGMLLDEFAVPYLKRNMPDSALLYLTKAISNVLQKQEPMPVYEPPMSDEERDAMNTVGGCSIFTVIWLLLTGRLRKKGLVGNTTPRLTPLLSDPTEDLALAAGTAYGAQRSGGSRSSWSGGGSSGGGHFGGGSFGGGGASRKW